LSSSIEALTGAIIPDSARHIESFDGIRGLAILLVLIGHAGWFADGWVGVDLFFVLSGFLITRILRRSKGERNYWLRFYIKRATRILPPLALTIVIVGLLWPHQLPSGLLVYLLSFGNIADLTTRFNVWPLEHLWSLSVEEHFYMLWPVAVLWFSRSKLQAFLIALVVALPVTRLAFTYLLPRHPPNIIYYLTPFRIDGIALGCLLALLLEQTLWQEILRRWAGAGALLLTGTYLTLWTRLGHSHFFPFAYSGIFNSVGYSLVALTSFFVIAFAYLRPASLPTRLLSNPMLRGLGTVSYGVYVYSWTLLQFGGLYFPHISSGIMGIAHIIVGIGLAAVLFRYYEQPIIRWGKGVALSFGREREVVKVQ
jgi:peptidoglycan/LPS O-acetylase OafA/YrhL